MKSHRFIGLIMVVLAIGGIASPVHAQTLEEGIYNLETERYARARTIFQSLLQKAPSADAYYYLGAYYLAVQQPDSAASCFEKGLELDPKRGLNYAGIGEIEIINGHLDLAATNFQQATKISRSKDAEVFYRIGLSYLRHEYKDLDKAITALENAIELRTNVANYHLALGDAYLQSGVVNKAVASYEQAIYFDSKMARAYQKIGDVYVRAREYQEALAKFQEGLNADPGYAPLYRATGEIYFLARQYPKAIEIYDKFDANSTLTPEDRLKYAGYLYLDKQYTESLEQLLRVGDSLDNPAVYRLLAYNYFETKQYEPGLQSIETFFERVEPTEILPSDYENYGRLLLVTGRDTLAGVDNLRKAVEMDSTRVDLHREIAVTFFTGRKYAEAANEYDLLAARGVTLSATDYLNQGKAFYYGQQYQKADSVFALVNAMAASSNVGWLWRARASSRLDPESVEGLARPYYEKYIELTTDSDKFKRELIEANFYLGFYYFQKNDKTPSESYLKTVAALEPEHENARTLLEALTQNP